MGEKVKVKIRLFFKKYLEKAPALLYSLVFLSFLGIELALPTSLSRASSPSVPKTSSLPLDSAPDSEIEPFSIKNPTRSGCDYISPTATGVYVCNKNFFFAHSNHAFRWIRDASEGETFTVSENGTTETYKIAKIDWLPMDNAEDGKLPVQNFYSSMTDSLSYRGKTYDAVLMTCGRGDDDNHYRTFVFAYRV